MAGWKYEKVGEVTQMNEWFEREWIGIAQVFMIEKTVKEKGEETTEISYGLTSVPRKKANAARVLDLQRKHWYIENRLHYRRDVTDGEKMLLKCALVELQKSWLP